MAHLLSRQELHGRVEFAPPAATAWPSAMEVPDIEDALAGVGAWAWDSDDSSEEYYT